MSINDNRFAQHPNEAMKQSQPPGRRHQPLPERHPKPGSEDPDAPARIAAIVENPSYREADQDPDFLRRADMRGVRLALDYEKPEQLLAEHDVAHSIVVFGSTRIPEPAAARRNREVLAAALAARPDDLALGERLAKEHQLAFRLGRDVASGWLTEMTSAALVNPTPEDYRQAGDRIRALADQSITLFDAVAAVIATRLGLAVWTYDHHFDVMRVPVWR